jgi:hypothetical protein
MYLMKMSRGVGYEKHVVHDTLKRERDQFLWLGVGRASDAERG